MKKYVSKLNCWIILYVFILMCCTLRAFAEDTASLQTKTTRIPAGFEDIQNDYDGPTTLIIRHENIGTALISFKDKSDQIILSKKAQTLIIKHIKQYTTDKGFHSLKLSLKTPLKANTTLQSPYLARSMTHLSVSFDLNNLKLYIFIPSKYLKDNGPEFEYRQQHPKTTYTQPAWSNQIRLNYENTDRKHEYPWNINGQISSGKLQFHYDANNYLHDYFDQLYLRYYGKKHIYTAGYQEPLWTNSYLSAQNFWGISMRESPKLINTKFYKAYQSPLLVQIEHSSQVKILHRGNVLYDKTLFPGQNSIDTSNFPLGTYKITIQKTDLLSNITTEYNETFTKGSSLYNWMYSGFEAVAGIHSEYLDLSNPHTEPYSKYIYLKNGFNLFNGSFDMFYTLNQHRHYLGLQYEHIEPHQLNYDFYTTINNHHDIFIGGNYYFHKGPSTYQINFNDTHHKEKDPNNLRQYNFSYSYRVGNTTSQIVMKYLPDHDIGLYTAIEKNFKFFSMPMRISFSISHDHNEKFQGLVRATFFYNKDQTSTNASINYNTQASVPNILVNGHWNNDIFRISENLDMPINLNDSILNLEGSAQHPLAEIHASTHLNYENHHVIVNRKRIGINTTLIATPQRMTFANTTAPTGFLVHIPKVDDSENYLIHINDKTVHAGSTHFIPRPPFYKGTIQFSPATPDRQIDPAYYSTFFYPTNIHNISLKIKEICHVSFLLDTQKSHLFKLENHSELFFEPNEEISFSLPDQTPLKFMPITENDTSDSKKICDTGVSLNCSKSFVNLGVLKCKDQSTLKKK